MRSSSLQARSAMFVGVGLSFILVACGGAGSSPRSAASPTSTSRTPATTPRAQLAAPPVVTVSPAPWRLSRASAREVVIADKGSLLVLGGFDGSKQTTSQVLRVNPATGVTTEIGALADAVHDAAGASVAGVPTVFGGGNSAESATVQQLAADGTAAVVARLPVPRSDLGAAAVGPRAFLVGGYDGANVRATALATSDGVTFQILGDLPVPVRYPAVAAAGTDVLIVGGTTRATDSAAGDTAAVQALDTRTGAVRVVGHLPQTLAHASATTVRGRVYVFGGRWGGVPTGQVWQWDSATAALVPVGLLPAAVTDGAAAAIGDTAYFVGGESPDPTATVSELRVR